MKIGIIGSGAVGQVLATAFLQEGHEVMLGTRDTNKPEVQGWKTKNKSGHVGLFSEVAAFGELLVLAVAGEAAQEAIKEAGEENLAGKIVIDATNPIEKSPPENGVLRYFTTINESLMERLQKQIPQAQFVKAFNSVGNGVMYQPTFREGRPTMFICGNNDAAKKTVTEILTAFGWDAEDMGGTESARAIEPLAMLWCIPGFVQNQWGHAFKLLKP
jgi:predicted dinucleotide-binding enzyme